VSTSAGPLRCGPLEQYIVEGEALGEYVLNHGDSSHDNVQWRGTPGRSLRMGNDSVLRRRGQSRLCCGAGNLAAGAAESRLQQDWLRHVASVAHGGIQHYLRPDQPFKLNDTGTASLAGTFGTTTLNWYTPTRPGANPQYWSVARVDPK